MTIMSTAGHPLPEQPGAQAHRRLVVVDVVVAVAVLLALGDLRLVQGPFGLGQEVDGVLAARLLERLSSRFLSCFEVVLHVSSNDR
jgi:hypothetical protein